MKSGTKMKTVWTWDEWQAERAARKAISDKVARAIIRRSESAADRHLRTAFDGERGPAFNKSFCPPPTD